MGGSNQSLFLMAALFVGQGDILGQGSAAVPLLIVGLLLSYAAAPGWTELVLMFPNRIGGIAATCAEAFRPYSPVLANLTGVCYWWGWVPTCGLTAILSASAIHEWYLPSVPIDLMACGLVLFFMLVNLAGVKWVARLVIPIAATSAVLAFFSGLLPILSGQVDWQQATTFHLTTPFDGWFGELTALMAGLYLVGFAAPAFEAATCHVGETRDPAKQVPKAVLASALMAAVYFLLLPLVWLGSLGPEPLGKELALVLGPTFAPLFGSAAKAAAIWFMMFNMFHGTVQPLAGASRVLSQLAEDGLLPKVLALRASSDAPWVATLLTAAMAILFLLMGDPIWLIAAANFTYLIGICLPSVAVWLLRRDQPQMQRPYRAPRGMIGLGLAAAAVWGASAILGFQQFGMPTVLFGLVFAYSGAAMYALRKYQDRRELGLPGVKGSLHIKLTGAMIAVLILDAAGYLLAVQSVPPGQTPLVALLEDLFVAVAMLTISVGLVLPGMIAHSAVEVSNAARRLSEGTVRDFSRAMLALGDGKLELAHARVDHVPVPVNSRDELGEMATSFNVLQEEIADAARGLDGARRGLHEARESVNAANAQLEQRVIELHDALAQRQLAEEHLQQAKQAAESANNAKSAFLANMSHELRTPLNGMLGMTEILMGTSLDERQRHYARTAYQSGSTLLAIINDMLDFSKIEAGKLEIDSVEFELRQLMDNCYNMLLPTAVAKGLQFNMHIDPLLGSHFVGDPGRLRQVFSNLAHNAIKFTDSGQVFIRIERDRKPGDDTPAGTVRLRFSVEDTGPGLTAEQQKRLFQSFSQADNSTTRKHGGTGLGLAISRQLVELMGGHIGVDSVPGEGCCFWFSMPLRQAAAVESAKPASPRLPPAFTGKPVASGARVLLAEDHPVNQDAARILITTLGYSVDIVGNGLLALEAVKQNRYDLILMDCQMPEMDGYEAAKAIRAWEKEQQTGSRLVIIALTAHAMKGDREACIAAGMDDYLAKPYTLEQLDFLLKRYATA